MQVQATIASRRLTKPALLWVAANMVSLVVTVFVIALVTRDVLFRPTWVNWLLVGAAILPLGVGQWLVMRQYAPHMSWWRWSVPTALAGMVGGFAATLLTASYSLSFGQVAADLLLTPYPRLYAPLEPVLTDLSVIGWATVGVCVGLAQTLMLARYTKGWRWWLWLPAGIIAWAAGGSLVQLYLAGPSWDAAGGLAYTALFGLMVGGPTALLLALFAAKKQSGPGRNGVLPPDADYGRKAHHPQ